MSITGREIFVGEKMREKMLGRERERLSNKRAAGESFKLQTN